MLTLDVADMVALIADVTVDRATGSVTVDRVVCAQDMGVVVNPEGARMQMEGCIIMGLSSVLTEEIHFDGGAIKDRNFDTYEIPRRPHTMAVGEGPSYRLTAAAAETFNRFFAELNLPVALQCAAAPGTSP